MAWTLVQQVYAPHTLDLFALASNVQCNSHGKPLGFFSPFPNTGCSGVNCFAETISSAEKFVSPQPCPLTIISPDLRPRQYWWAILRVRVRVRVRVLGLGLGLRVRVRVMVNTVPLVVLRSAPKVRKISFFFPTLF